MFWERLSILIKERDISANGLAKQIGLSNCASVKWKKGAIPDSSTLQKIADYYNVSVDYLLGKEKEPSVQNGEFDELTMQFNNLLGKLSQEQKEALIPLLESMIQQKK